MKRVEYKKLNACIFSCISKSFQHRLASLRSPRLKNQTTIHAGIVLVCERVLANVLVTERGADMPKFHYAAVCPNCSHKGSKDYFWQYEHPSFIVVCKKCYFPLTFDTKKKTVEIQVAPVNRRAFLIHSSKPEEKKLLDWFRELMHLYGIPTTVIEEDPRSVDWLQKSLEGISSADFVLVFLTKRYQFTDETGKMGWKAPDKCYDEIAMVFALHKDIVALIEKEVDSGRVLDTRAWCYRFS